MVKSETCQDAEILVRNLSARLFGKKFRDSKNVKQTMQKWDFETDQKCFRDIFRDPTQIFSRPTFFEVPFATPKCSGANSTSRFWRETYAFLPCLPLSRFGT